MATFNEPSAPIYITTGAGGAGTVDVFGEIGALDAVNSFSRSLLLILTDIPPGENWGPWTLSQLSQWGYGRMVAHNASHLTYTHVLNCAERAKCPQGKKCSEQETANLPCLNTTTKVHDVWTVVRATHGPFE